MNCNSRDDEAHKVNSPAEISGKIRPNKFSELLFKKLLQKFSKII